MSFVCPNKYPNDGSAVQHMNWLFERPTNMPFLVKILSRHLKPGYLSMSCGKIHTLAPGGCQEMVKYETWYSKALWDMLRHLNLDHGGPGALRWF